MITDVNDLVYADYTEENGNKKLTDVIIIEQDDNAVNPNLPVVNAYDYEVDYSTPSAVKVNYYTGLDNDINTMINVIISVMTDDGYTNFKVSEASGIYTIEATKGYVTTTFKYQDSNKTECVKISLNGESMLAKKGVNLDAAGVTLNGTYAEGVKKDGTPIARNTVGNIAVLDGAAYETFYEVTVTSIAGKSYTYNGASTLTLYMKASDSATINLSDSTASGWTGYKAELGAPVTGISVTSTASTDDTKVAFTLTTSSLAADANVTIKVSK